MRWAPCRPAGHWTPSGKKRPCQLRLAGPVWPARQPETPDGPCESAGMTTFVIDAQVAIDLATGGATIPAEHSLTAPTLLRSQALALVYESVHRGEIDERAGRKILDDIRGLRIRFLGDRSLEDHAWRLAAKLNWPDIYQVEYIVLTQLQADALVTSDDKLAAAARAFVKTASPADILRP